MTPDKVCTLALDIACRTGWSIGPWCPHTNAVELPHNASLGDNTVGGAVDLGPAGPGAAGARLYGLRKLISELHKVYGFKRLAVEDSAYGSRNQFKVQLQQAEQKGVARLTAHQLGIEFIAINPGSWKVWLTGNRSAKKDQCAAALAGQFKVRFADQNEADSYAILAAVLAGVR